MANLKETLRMCIVCRDRCEQKSMLRLINQDKKIGYYNGSGRSFYICSSCLNGVKLESTTKEYKKLEKALFREYKNKDNYVEQLKEILTDVR